MKNTFTFSVKKIALAVLFTALCMGSGFAQDSSDEGSKGAITVGGFLGYGLEIKELAIGAIGQYFITDKLAVQADLGQYLIGDGFTLREFSANVNYYFPLKTSSIRPYALAGLTMSFASFEFLGVKESSSDTALGIGGGADFPMDKLIPFAQLKYVASEEGQIVLQAGVRFRIK